MSSFGPADGTGREEDRILVVDAANVVGSRPDGWWRDRPKAARKLCQALADALGAGRLTPLVVVVLEGVAREGAGAGERDGLRVVHSPGSGDDTIAALVAGAVGAGQTVTVVTADRELGDRTRAAGADVVGPRWLLART